MSDADGTGEAYARLVQRAIAAREAGNPVASLAATDQLVSSRADDASVRLLRAELLLELSQAGPALAEARLAVLHAPVMPEAYRALALAAARLGRRAEAQAGFERALELSHRQSDVLQEYALFLLDNRGSKLAEAAANELVTVQPQSSGAWAILGAARLLLHNHAAAEQALRRSLQIDPHNSWATENLAYLLKLNGQSPEADALVDRLQDAPPTPMAQWLKERLKDQQTAQKLLERKEFTDGYFGGRPRALQTILPALTWIAAGIAAIVGIVLMLEGSSHAVAGRLILTTVGIILFCRWVLNR